jgi:hypothetical protein
MSKREFVSELRGHLDGRTTAADFKASVVFAASSALVAYLSHQFYEPVDHTLVGTAFQILALVSFLVAASLAGYAFTPRTKSSTESVSFFGTISSSETSAHYVARVISQTDDQLIEEELSHIYDISKIVNKKFSILSLSILACYLGLAFTVLWFILSVLSK